MRKLATVQTIKTLDKIEGKDRVVYASFENVGFRVIVSTDFNVGEKVVYCEVDSILPQRPEFDFLKSRCYVEKLKGYRIKNMRLCGLYSEGIVFKLNILKEKTYADGQDVTKELNITKYDPEASMELKVKGTRKHSKLIKLLLRFSAFRYIYNKIKKRSDPLKPWPKWARKSDETRAQNLNYIYEKYVNENFYYTEKLDGSSTLYGYVDDKFVVCSRNYQVKNGSAYWKFAIDNDLKNIFKKVRGILKEDFYVQGELIGPGIQKNRYNLKEYAFFAYNFYLLKQKRYVGYHTLDTYTYLFKKDTTTSDLIINKVPYLGSFSWQVKNIQELLDLAKGVSQLNSSIPREGIVVRSVEPRAPDEDQSNMLSFKVINPDFEINY